MKHFERRISAVRDIMKCNSVDAFLITKRENYIYLSGFNGTSAYLLITQNEVYIFTDFRYVEQATVQTNGCKVVQYEGNVFVSVNQVLKDDGIVSLGFESDYITYAQYEDFSKNIGIDILVPLNDEIKKLRDIKDHYEIEKIQKAVEIADGAFLHILNYIKPKITEMEIAAELEYYMRKNGAKGSSFEIIVASGLRSSMPHGVASSKKLEIGDVIILDYGAIYDDYCSDISRTVFLGDPKQELKQIYNLVLKAQIEAINNARANLMCSELDGIARDIIYDGGFKENFGHGLGHGVGLEIHESPRLSPYCNLNIANNMVATIEPGVYVPGVGGVRIEDIVVIENIGARVLTKASKEMIII